MLYLCRPSPASLTNVHDVGDVSNTISQAGKLSTQPKMLTAEVPADDDMPRISWRGDGEYFVTSSKHDGARRLRMWDRNAILQSTSEKVAPHLSPSPCPICFIRTYACTHNHGSITTGSHAGSHSNFPLPASYGLTMLLNASVLPWDRLMD